jgi:hypothetical protein
VAIWDDLIAESRKLDETASKIQLGETVGLSKEDIEKLSADYHLWYGKCLSLLLEDLRARFRSEYDGVWYSPKVKKFLEASTEPLMFRPNDDQGKEIWSYWAHPYERAFAPCILSQRQILVEASMLPTPTFVASDAVSKIELLAQRFSLIARTLAQRGRERTPLIISDEYDVQYLFKGLLKVFFDDIRPEEWTPSYAGKSTRVDFLVKSEQIVVELKMTRAGLKTTAQVGEELIIDIHHYRFHSDCKTLVAFVYDPDKYIDEPKSLENDLSKTIDGMPVKVIVAQS